MTPGTPGPAVYDLLRYPLRSLPAPTHRPLLHAWWTCHNGVGGFYRDASDCLLSTGDPISVVPPQIRHDMDLAVTDEAGWAGRRVSWRGVGCRVARALLCLHDTSGVPRDFSLLVLLPNQTPPDMPPYIHLGSQFLDEYAVTAEITPAAGRLLIP